MGSGKGTDSVTEVPGSYYSAKSGLTHFCAIKSPKSTDILLNMYFTDFHWIPLLPVLDSTNISS